MSILSAFANAGFSTASTVIGTVSVSIGGGSAIAAVKSEARHARDFEDGGFAPDAALELVARTSVFATAYTSATNAYVGNLATIGNATYRIESISSGASTTTITLSHEEDG